MGDEPADETRGSAEVRSRGPLCGVRVVEFAGLGPGPHCAMLLSDMGAEVLRIGRPGAGHLAPPNPILERGRAWLTLDLTTAGGRERCLSATDQADVLIEGYRPGVMERLGLGPDTLLARNPKLVYGRMTGWGQEGPLAQAAGHDINYIALTGALAAIGPGSGPPLPPLNLVGDFGGGSLYLAFGILAALLERERSGRGQVVDAAIVDGVSHLMALCTGLAATGFLSLQRPRSLLAGAAPCYRCYTCADGRDIAVGALEPRFYRELLTRIGAPLALLTGQYDPATWAAASAQLAAIFATRERDAWCQLLAGTDACVAPVLTIEEAAGHPQMAARQTYVEQEGMRQPAPAPRLSRTPGVPGSRAPGEELLARWLAEPRTRPGSRQTS